MTSSKTRIAILGVGAVGGYFGGKLAAHYDGSIDTEVIFIARGANAAAIQLNGLKLITPECEQVIHPAAITSDPKTLGQVEFILCCVKGFDLESSLERLAPCISEDTVVLPLLNGVDASARAKAVLPQAEVWEGCVYVVSRLISPGVVRQSGSIRDLYFGSEDADRSKLERFESILQASGLNVHLSDNISQTVWEKFMFLSPLATLTSYLDVPVGGIVGSADNFELLKALLRELKTVADAKDIELGPDAVEMTLEKIKALPPDATTSMHTDFQANRKTKLQSITGIVVNFGQQLGIPTPNYEAIFKSLQAKAINALQESGSS